MMTTALLTTLVGLGLGVSKKVNTKYLRIAIAVIIAITGLKMWSQLVSQ